MRCYNEGHLMRSIFCVGVATALNVGLVLLAMAYTRYNWNLVTILSRLLP